MPRNDRVYMIRKDGLYSQGGYYGGWVDKSRGKVWNSIGPARSAITSRDSRRGSAEPFYYGAEIVELELIEVTTHPLESEQTRRWRERHG